MKHNQNLLLSLIWLMLLTSAVAQAPAPQPAALPIGTATIAAVKGAVTFKSAAGSDIPSAQGQALVPGTVIETAKGSTVLNLPDGSQVQVKANSRVVIRDPRQDNRSSLELFIGKLLAKIQKRIVEAPSFRMGTPSAVITVRGTEFSVEVNKKTRTQVYVYEGMVELAGTVPGAPVMIRAGFYSTVDPNRPPETPRPFGPADSVRGPNDAPGYDASRSSNDPSTRRVDDPAATRQSSGSSESQPGTEHDH